MIGFKNINYMMRINNAKRDLFLWCVRNRLYNSIDIKQNEYMSAHIEKNKAHQWMKVVEGRDNV